MDRDAILGEITALKMLLAGTDYKCLKYAEGALAEDEYAETKQQRAEWREKINELEALLDEAEEAMRVETETVEEYMENISSGNINAATGELWKLEDIPERWRDAVEALLSTGEEELKN